MGMEIARAVRDQATNPPDPETPPRFKGDLVLMFARAAKAVRQTLALEERLAAERQGEAARTAGQREDRAAWDRIARHSARRSLIIDVVDGAIESCADPEKVEDIQAEWAERLDDDALNGDLFSAPVSEIVADICSDLGVVPDWSLWEEADWAREEAAQDIPGSPYAHAPEPEGEDLEFDASPPPRVLEHHPP